MKALKTFLVILFVLLFSIANAQNKGDIEDFDLKDIEIAKTKEPVIKDYLQKAITKQLADEKPFQIDVKDIKFVDDEETKEVRGIVHHHYRAGGADTLIIIDDLVLRGRTVNGVFTSEVDMKIKVD